MKTTYLSIHLYRQGRPEHQTIPGTRQGVGTEIESAGVKVLAQLWTVGAYDGAILLEGSDEKQILRALARLSALGNVRTHSLRAFDAEEFVNIAGA